MSEVEREYFYKNPTGILRLAGVLMTILAPLEIYITCLDPGGMELDGGITLTHNQAILYMGALGIVLLVGGINLLRASMRTANVRSRIAFTADSLIFVNPVVGGPEQTIAYKDITDISTSTVKKQRFLHFRYPGGSVDLCSDILKSKKVFEEVAVLLQAKVRAAALKESPEGRAVVAAPTVTETPKIQDLRGGGS